MIYSCLLEVLIPTFDRPEAAIRAIKSVLDVDDPRIKVRCNSNGREPTLEHFCSQYPNVHYDSFTINLGPEANVHKLLSEATGEFVMLLADEDSLDNTAGKQLLDFLAESRADCQVVSCAVYDTENERFYYNLGEALTGKYVNLPGFTILSSSTYMSGYIWKTSSLSGLDLRLLTGANLKDSDAPKFIAYSHIDISQLLLKNGTCGFYMEKCINKGAQISSGGLAFAHRTATPEAEQNNLDLNPSVYGPYARARQFFYRESILTKLKDHFPALSYIVAEAMLYTFFFERLLYSSQVVVFEEEMTIESEAVKAIADAQIAGHVSGSTLSNLFSESILRTASEAELTYERMSALKENLPPEFIATQLLVA
jgi:glycosyltransferase involved in cell wall biosynthesis